MGEMLGFKPVEMTMSFTDVDPQVLEMLVGSPVRSKAPEFSVEVWTPVKRTFWQWLTRKPRRYTYMFIPNAIIKED